MYIPFYFTMVILQMYSQAILTSVRLATISVCNDYSTDCTDTSTKCVKVCQYEPERSCCIDVIISFNNIYLTLSNININIYSLTKPWGVPLHLVPAAAWQSSEKKNKNLNVRSF